MFKGISASPNFFTYQYYNRKELKAQHTENKLCEFLLSQKSRLTPLFQSVSLLMPLTLYTTLLSLSEDPRHLSNPIHHPQQPAGKYAIQNHRPCNGENLTSDTEDCPSACVKLGPINF